MKLLGSLAIAFSMYSRIPMPQVEWTEEKMKYAMCFFPMVGVAQGLLLYAAANAAWAYGSQILYCVCGLTLPLLVNGGIHMDGFLDVLDARASHGEKEKKLEILKDPHAGAFAITGCMIYAALYAGFFAELPVKYLPAMGAVYVMTRSLSGLSVVCFPKARTSGLAAAFSNGADKKITAAVLAVWAGASLGFLIWSAGAVAGGICAVAAAVVFLYYYRMSRREFGGITGDLAGYFLQICELVVLAILVLAFR